jgi:hypothetical protein
VSRAEGQSLKISAVEERKTLKQPLLDQPDNAVGGIKGRGENIGTQGLCGDSQIFDVKIFISDDLQKRFEYKGNFVSVLMAIYRNASVAGFFDPKMKLLLNLLV